MDKYYHFTNFNSFNHIIYEGLVPQNGFRCQSIGDEGCGVFLSKGIENSILMYSLMLSYFEKYWGPEGDAVIQEEIQLIQELNKPVKHALDYYSNRYRVDECNAVIQRVFQIKRCRDFIEYLGGPGCLLSVSGISCDQVNNLENCFYEGVISPDKINVVSIRNKYYNYLIYSLYPVLSYLMYLYPLNDIINNVKDENKNSIYKLYQQREVSGCLGYDLQNFDLLEIPISYFNYDFTRKKTLAK